VSCPGLSFFSHLSKAHTWILLGGCKILLSSRAKKLLLFECTFLGVLTTALLTLVFSRSYIFHFEQLTFNVYRNGSVDFTADATSLVRSLGTVAVLSLFVGVSTGVAIGLTCCLPPKASNSTPGLSEYEREITKLGLVVINKTEGATSYTLTDHGRHFLRDYRFLESTEEKATA